MTFAYRSIATAAFALALTALTLVPSQPANAIIHEMVGADCSVNGAPVPNGQTRAGTQSFARALQATGVISSIDVTATAVTINFDLTRPNAKYTSAGFNLTIPDAFGPGVALVLAPLPVPDPGFPAFANCRTLNPKP